MSNMTGQPPDVDSLSVLREADLAEDRLRSELGARVRAARQRRGLTGQRLAELVGLTRSLISQIELGQVTPSVSTVFRITHALGITAGDLFDTQPSTGSVLHRKDWEPVHFGISDDVVLSTDREQRVSVLWSEFPPGVVDEEGTVNNADHHFVFVVRGLVNLRVGETTHVLEEDSCITFDGRVRHYWSNPGSEPAEVLSVTSPAV
jgi:transcriptional regulator with XRE-family HTH domain